MSTSELGLKSYYQRDWANALPTLSDGVKQKVWHVAGLALPFIGILYAPAGRAISCASTSLNAISIGSELSTAPSWTKQHAWTVVKHGAEFVGTIVSLRIGLALHSGMTLGENLYALRDFRQISWSQASEKMLPVVSNALFLLTLCATFSNPVSYGILGASLLFQGGWSLYKARQASKEAKSWTDIKMLDAAAHTALAGIYFTKAGNAILLCHKVYNAVERTFILMRPASKHNKNTPEGGLSEKGRNLLPKMGAALYKIHDKKVFYTSPANHHRETADILSDITDGAAVTVLEELHETKKPVKIQDKEAKLPPYIIHKNLPKDQQWVTSPDATQGIESPAEVAARMDRAVRDILSKQPEGVPVIVTGGTAIKRFLQGEVRANPSLSEEITGTIKDGGIRIFTMTPNDVGDLVTTKVIIVDPRKMDY